MEIASNVFLLLLNRNKNNNKKLYNKIALYKRNTQFERKRTIGSRTKDIEWIQIKENKK